MQIHAREPFSVSAETYWKELCLNLAFQERLYREALGCDTVKVIKNEGDFATGVRRHMRYTKKSDAPAAIQKIFGETMELEEMSEFNARDKRWTFRVVPAVMADRLDVSGDVTLEEAADGTIVQVGRQTFACKIFGLGGLVEKFIAKSFEKGELDKARFTRAYIQEKKL